MSINLSVPAGIVIPELKPKLTVIGVGGAGGKVDRGHGQPRRMLHMHNAR